MSSITKDQLIFDTSAVADSDSVGAFVRSSDGTLIDHVTIATVDRLAVDATLNDGAGNDLSSTAGALHVDVQNASIVVTATDLDIRDLDYTQDNVEIKDAGGDALAINADGSINSVVTATDLDIRDLTHVSDSVKIGDGTDLLDILVEDAASAGGEKGIMPLGIRQDAGGSPVSADGDYHPFVFNDDGELKVAADLVSNIADDAADSGNPHKVGSRSYNQGSALGTVDASDRADMLSDLYRRVFINSSPNVGLLASTESISDSASNIASSPLAGRMKMLIQNVGDNEVYLGHSGVTSSNGIILRRRTSVEFDLGEALDLYAVCASTESSELRLLELA